MGKEEGQKKNRGERVEIVGKEKSMAGTGKCSCTATPWNCTYTIVDV